MTEPVNISPDDNTLNVMEVEDVMMKIPISVKRDHIEALIATKKPLFSIAELIWNSLDADADRVTVRFERNAIDGLESIRLADNGTGISYDLASELFGNLGGSWKAVSRRTPKGRSLHGKTGKGRFRAFALGELVEWRTTSKQKDDLVDFTVRGDATNLESFELTNPIPSIAKSSGTEVFLYNLHKNYMSLSSDGAPKEITNLFAVYLSEFPGITIDYNGTIIDPASAQKRVENIDLGSVVLSCGNSIPAALTIIEWNDLNERALHLCDAKGVSLHQVSPGIHAPGFNFTAYLKSDYLRELDQQNLLILGEDELHQDLSTLIRVAKDRLKEYFRVKAAEDSVTLLQEWKDERIYPYEGAPGDKIEEAERQVFDVVAVNINSYLPDFDKAKPESKRFTFNLVKEALKENPESLKRIIQDVLALPKEQQEDFAQLLQKTTLPAIISSAKIVTNRLDFLRALEALLFDKESKKQLLERDQLHHILAKESWIFGEEFHLTHNEETLNDVLDKHLKILRKPLDDDSPITLEDGSTGRIDLMLARSIPLPRADEREYLVVELKRPSKRICTTVLGQVEDYAMAVAKDERFRDTKTKWIFWAVSNDMTDEARRKARQRGRPDGLVFDDPELNITVWAKSWGNVIQDCRGRLNFFKEKLNYEADRFSATQYLLKTHEKYIPSCIKSD